MSNLQDSETALPETFDPATQEGSRFNLLPVSWYKAQITDASVSQPKSNNGWGINLTWQITEGEYEGRFVWQYITFIHSSTQAVEIGRRQFKDLCVATGVDEQVTDVAVFKFIPCQIRVGIEPDKTGLYDDKNRVSRILPIDAPVKQPKQSAKSAQPVKSSASATTTAVPNATTQPTATAAPAAKPASNAASGANGNVPPWRQAKPSPSKDLDDEVPF
jgi:hypothetical protein